MVRQGMFVMTHVQHIVMLKVTLGQNIEVASLVGSLVTVWMRIILDDILIIAQVNGHYIDVGLIARAL
jgi:hypothetical protein